MLIRIVKMSFEPDKISTFLENFDQNKDRIRNFEGCDLLELYRDKKHQNIFFTYSYWQNESHLNAYKNSVLFKEVWSKTKILFNKKPQAWSVDKIAGLP